MSPKLIPKYIDPSRYTGQQLRLQGVLPVVLMTRVQSHLLDTNGELKVELQFGVDTQNQPFLQGHIEVSLKLQCQRCMEALPYEIMADFALGIVKSLGEAENLPKQYEPVLIGEQGLIALRELAEDEVILNLPIVPKHAFPDCKVKLADSQAKDVPSKEKHPFIVLESLKRQQNSGD